jgi:hypothetical protein
MRMTTYAALAAGVVCGACLGGLLLLSVVRLRRSAARSANGHLVRSSMRRCLRLPRGKLPVVRA